MNYNSEKQTKDTVAFGWTETQLEDRRRAVASNAVHAILEPLGRDAKSFSDNDAAIVESIYQLLCRLETHDQIDAQYQHDKLNPGKIGISRDVAAVRKALQESSEPLKPRNWSKPHIASGDEIGTAPAGDIV